MKKYNTPKMKVDMFNRESIMTDSTALGNFNALYNTEGTIKYTTTWDKLQSEGIDVTF